jgi:hypothetical protein
MHDFLAQGFCNKRVLSFIEIYMQCCVLHICEMFYCCQKQLTFERERERERESIVIAGAEESYTYRYTEQLHSNYLRHFNQASDV